LPGHHTILEDLLDAGEGRQAMLDHHPDSQEDRSPKRMVFSISAQHSKLG
jgi:hypothetical protein